MAKRLPLTQNLHRASQGAPCSALKLGSVPIYHPHPIRAISALWFAWSREIDRTKCREGVRSSRLFRSPDHKPTSFYQIVRHYQPIKLREAKAVSQLVPSLLLAMEPTPGKTHFFDANFIKYRILSKIMCHSLTKGRSSSRRSSLLHYHSPDLNPEQRSLSAQFIFFLVTLFSCFRTAKLLVHTSS